jgi:aryl-alcohol dehydrogenase-like predicted oxidoreductase
MDREYVSRGLMTPDDLVAGGHCVAPAYLADQLARSRANLMVETVDVYYLHNPEQQLDAVSRETFLERMRAAFELLEARCAAGEIGRYGCATWTGFRVPPDQRGHLSLRDLVDVARDVGGDDHHFRVVQLPINLALNEAIRTPTQHLGAGDPVTLLEAAAALGVAVVASATLMQSKLAMGLPPQMRELFPGLRTDAQRAIAFVRSLPVVSSALVGMKTPAHVEENLAAAKERR